MKLKKEIKKYSALTVAILLLATVPLGAHASGTELVPMGNTIGILMNTDGVMVAGLSATNSGTAPSPAAKAGILPGDLITGIAGDKIANAEDFRKAIAKTNGEAVALTIERDGETMQMTVELDMASGVPEIGLWLRDSISGIGTMTYYNPKTGEYGGLGHSISDAESGALIPLGRGDIMRSVVVEVVPSSAGKPGELHGIFDMNAVCGSILQNTSCGIFGKLNQGIPVSDKAIPIATEAETELGAATILSNISGSDIEEFDVEIVRLYKNDISGRSMMIKICDEDLIRKTGGIVQGMSGSPIIQNGKLIGAVTHVLINEPTKGFGVSLEKMLNQSKGDNTNIPEEAA